MKITHICLAGTITDEWTYQENLLLKYHRMLGMETSAITSRWVYKKGSELYKFPQKNYYLKDGTHMIRLDISNKDDLHYKFKRYDGLMKSLEMLSPDILFIHGCQFLDIDTIVKYLKKHRKCKVYVDNHADFSNSATNFISKYFLHGIIWKKRAKMIEPYTTTFYGVLPARVDFLRNVYKLSYEKTSLDRKSVV